MHFHSCFYFNEVGKGRKPYLKSLKMTVSFTDCFFGGGVSSQPIWSSAGDGLLERGFAPGFFSQSFSWPLLQYSEVRWFALWTKYFVTLWFSTVKIKVEWLNNWLIHWFLQQRSKLAAWYIRRKSLIGAAVECCHICSPLLSNCPPYRPCDEGQLDVNLWNDQSFDTGRQSIAWCSEAIQLRREKGEEADRGSWRRRRRGYRCTVGSTSSPGRFHHMCESMAVNGK